MKKKLTTYFLSSFRNIRLKNYPLILTILFLTVWSINLSGQSFQITGDSVVCANQTHSYSAQPAGNFQYVWNASGGQLVFDSSFNASVSFGNPGSGFVSLIVYDSAGTIILDTVRLDLSIYPIPIPRIIPSVNQLCMDLQYEDENDESFGLGFDDGACNVVCENAIVTYTAAGDTTGMTYNWEVKGDFISFQDFGRYIEVSWADSGQGVVHLEIISPAGCKGTKELCVKIVDKPIADFTQNFDDAICTFTDIRFIDQSIDAFMWEWDFGDGTTSTEQNPTHAYTAAGNYDISLIVENKCGCRDTALLNLDIEFGPKLELYCITTVCANSESSYSILSPDSDPCDEYDISVSPGGDIHNYDADFHTFDVTWISTAGPEEIITIVDPCSGCTRYFHIPVFNHDDSQIEGENTVCANSIEEYVMPLWPGTNYQWSLNPSNAGEIVKGQGDHIAYVEWDTTQNSAVLAVTYEHPILGGCSHGDDSLEIGIKQPFEVDGPEIICSNTSAEFEILSISGVTGSFRYLVTEEQTGNPVDSGQFSSATFNPVFPHHGVYLIRVTQESLSYCNDDVYLTLTVLDVPQSPDSILVKGEVNVCTATPYVYSYAGELPQGYYLRWDVTGADIDSSFSNPVSVNWLTVPGGVLTASFEQKDEPFCTSGGRDVNIDEIILDTASITGSDSVCNNSVMNYESHGEGDDYIWSISPNIAGSVVSGDGTPNAVIQWNNYTGFATVSVNRSVCDTAIVDQKTVELTDVPSISIVSPDTVCQFEDHILSVTPSTGINAYVWDFGLPAGDSVAQPNVSFPDSGTYFINVEAYYPGCARPSTDNKVIYVREAPVAFISTHDPLLECENPTLFGTVQGTIPGTPTYEWFENTTPPTSLGGGSTLIAPPAGEYFLVATLSSMVCPAVSNPVVIATCPTGVPPSGGGSPTPCTPADTIVASVTDLGCGNIEVNASINQGRITNVRIVDQSNVNFNSVPVLYTHDNAGFYGAVIEAVVANSSGPNPDSCLVFKSIPYEIELTADFYYFITCGPGNDYSFEFKNRSTHTPGNPITSIDWSSGAGSFATTFHANEDFLEGTVQTVTLEVNNGTQSCTTQQIIQVPDKPDAFFEPAQPACVHQAVLFTDLSAGNIKTWHWDYTEIDAYINGNSHYTYNAPSTNPHNNVTLTLTDLYNCTDQFDTSVVVSTTPFNASHQISSGSSLMTCRDSCVEVNFNSGSLSNLNYLWSTLETTQSIDVCDPGAYFLTVTDPATSCLNRYGPVRLGHYPPTAGAILGDTLLCQNEIYRFLGNSGNGITYNWFDSAFSHFSSFPNINYFSGFTEGHNHVYLELIDVISNCRDTSRFNFYVQPHLEPEINANVGVPFCENSGVTFDFTVNNPPVAAFHWNNGATTTPVAAKNPGPYLLTAYDDMGCSYSDTAFVDPLPYIQNFMCGCYEVCAEDSFLLPGVPGEFQQYTWLINGFPVASNSGSVSPQQLLFGTHHYQLVLESENGCADTTCTAEISTVLCDDDHEHPCDLFPCNDSCDLGIEPLGVDSCKRDAHGNQTYYASAAFFAPSFSGVIWYAEDQSGNPVNITGNPGIVQGQPNVTSFEMVPGGANPFCITFYIKPDNVDSLCKIEFCFEIPEIPCPRGKRSLSVEENNSGNSLTVYPNPARHTLHINFEGENPGNSFSIYAVTGEVIVRRSELPSEGVEILQTSHWPAGVYILHFHHKDGMTQIRKIIISQ